jgi:MoaA/NifB/PqqE/SkfB family radical SAM enzyme
MPSLVTIRDDWKIFESEDVSYRFNLRNGYTEVWGKNKDEDPLHSKYGPFIADIEIATSCSGINGKLCEYCYKSNTPNGENLSFENFKKIIKKINKNGQLQQVAFGLDAAATANPELWDMCDWLRSKYIVPNGTVADVSKETAMKIATHFGAVAVSWHNDFEVLAKNCARFAPTIVAHHSGNKNVTLSQLNIHFVIMEETFEDCKKLFKMVKSDPRFLALNAIVLLGLKKCGRAEKNNFNSITDEHFKELVDIAFEEKIGIGFDSCSCSRFISSIKDRPDFEELKQVSEPCESFGLFSSYINVKGNYYSCSFSEKIEEPMSVLNCDDFIEDIWYSKVVQKRREQSIKRGRTCPYYEI